MITPKVKTVFLYILTALGGLCVGNEVAQPVFTPWIVPTSDAVPLEPFPDADQIFNAQFADTID